jgi:hypothetical protein
VKPSAILTASRQFVYIAQDETSKQPAEAMAYDETATYNSTLQTGNNLPAIGRG